MPTSAIAKRFKALTDLNKWADLENYLEEIAKTTNFKEDYNQTTTNISEYLKVAQEKEISKSSAAYHLIKNPRLCLILQLWNMNLQVLNI